MIERAEILCPICKLAIHKQHRMQQLDTQLTYHIRKTHNMTIKDAKRLTRKAFNPELYKDELPVKQSQPKVKAQSKPQSTEPITITHNEKLNGIEIKFQSKPDDSVLNMLRDLGFRWSFKSFLWYNRYTPELMTKVQTAIN